MGEKRYRRTSHVIFDNKYHLVWITKYRYRVLEKKIAIRVREIIREVCREFDVEIIKGHVSADHIHMLVSIPPQYPVSKIMQYMEGKSSRKIQMEFKELKKRYWGQHIWSRGYFCATVGAVTEEEIKEYIENHVEDEEDITIGS